MNVRVRQGVRITTDRQGDARCIFNALLEYGGEFTQDDKGWAVQLSAPGAPELTAVLAALKICLDENRIAVVKVEIDGQAYAMEGMPEAVRAAKRSLALSRSLEEVVDVSLEET